MNKFEEIVSLQKSLEDKLKTFGKEAFDQAFSKFFADNPKVDGIVWTQYTPYFNDGDTCTFGVHEPYLFSASAAAENEESVEDYMHEHAISSYGNNNPLEGAYKEFGTIWQQIPEAIFLAVFGDHVKVTLNRDGTSEVEEYEHD